MKIALLGFGNMGKEISRIVAEQKKDIIVSVSYDNQNKILDKAGIKKADVVIDFTSPDIVMKNIEEVAKLQKPFVVGTSGWYDKIDTVKKIIAKQNSGLIYGNNFSIGVNIFFHILAYSASLFHKVKAYVSSYFQTSLSHLLFFKIFYYF